VEVNAEKTGHIFMFHHQNAGQTHSMKVPYKSSKMK